MDRPWSLCRDWRARHSVDPGSDVLSPCRQPARAEPSRSATFRRCRRGRAWSVHADRFAFHSGYQEVPLPVSYEPSRYFNCRLRSACESARLLPVAWSSRLDIARQLSAVGGKLLHDLLVQPDVHRGRVAHIAGVVEFGGKLLACRLAAVA